MFKKPYGYSIKYNCSRNQYYIVLHYRYLPSAKLDIDCGHSWWSQFGGLHDIFKEKVGASLAAKKWFDHSSSDGVIFFEEASGGADDIQA